MGLFPNLLLGLIHLALVLLDITCAFAIAQMVAASWPHPVVQAIADAGRPLVETVSERFRMEKIAAGVSERGRLCLLLAILCVVRMIFSVIVGVIR